MPLRIGSPTPGTDLILIGRHPQRVEKLAKQASAAVMLGAGVSTAEAIEPVVTRDS